MLAREWIAKCASCGESTPHRGFRRWPRRFFGAGIAILAIAFVVLAGFGAGGWLLVLVAPLGLVLALRRDPRLECTRCEMRRRGAARALECDPRSSSTLIDPL